MDRHPVNLKNTDGRFVSLKTRLLKCTKLNIAAQISNETSLGNCLLDHYSGTTVSCRNKVKRPIIGEASSVHDNNHRRIRNARHKQRLVGMRKESGGVYSVAIIFTLRVEQAWFDKESRTTGGSYPPASITISR